MERIKRLPLLMSFLAAVITGAASYAAGVDNRIIYLRMAVMMLVFFLLGAYLRNTVLSLRNEIKARKNEKKSQEEQNSEDQPEEKKAYGYAAEFHQEKADVSPEQNMDDFEPLVLSKAIKTKVKE